MSIGDYVLSGGEIAALALIDACVRLLPGVMGKEASGAEESFADGLLEYPQYTRPAVFEGQAIPEVLTSGDHAKVARLAAGRGRAADPRAPAGPLGGVSSRERPSLTVITGPPEGRPDPDTALSGIDGRAWPSGRPGHDDGGGDKPRALS